jgi:4-oxalocrotonate tautomerase
LGELQHEIFVSATSGPTKKQGEGMPLIQVKLIEGVFNRKQKAEIVKKLTDAMVSIQGERMRSVTWVVIEEVRSGEWGIGGEPITSNAVLALAAS